MTAADKQKLYEILRIFASGCGNFPSPEFDGPVPVFQDDISAKPSDITRIDYNPASRNTQTVSSTLEQISAKVAACTRCGLCRTRRNTVPGTGVPNPAVLVIGEGPGADEDAVGIPFVGRAGQLLDKMLAAISLSRDTNCYIANIVKCRPPGNRDPLPEESAACISFLEAQIAVLKPAMILAVGRIAAQKLLETQEGIGRLRGKIRTYQNIPFMATYHPSALLRNEDLKRPAWEDLKIFRTYLEQLCPGYDDPFKAGRT